MAGGTLTSNEVTNTNISFVEKVQVGKLWFKIAKLDMTSTQSGGTTNKIPASALGLSQVVMCGCLIKSDNSEVYPAAPSANGSFVAVADAADAAAASHVTPADLPAGTYYISLLGYE